MTDLTLSYRACGAECREDWLRLLACDNGLPLAEVERAAARLGEREDFGKLIDYCEGPFRSQRPQSLDAKKCLAKVQGRAVL